MELLKKYPHRVQRIAELCGAKLKDGKLHGPEKAIKKTKRMLRRFKRLPWEEVSFPEEVNPDEVKKVLTEKKLVPISLKEEKGKLVFVCLPKRLFRKPETYEEVVVCL